MTNNRTQAYGRVVKTLDELGPSKLLAAEQARIRDAADILIFASDVDETREALRDIGRLAEALVASGRWLEETVDRLIEDLLGCGPTQVPAAAVAPGRGSAPSPGDACSASRPSPIWVTAAIAISPAAIQYPIATCVGSSPPSSLPNSSGPAAPPMPVEIA